jgi:hypothetical protein
LNGCVSPGKFEQEDAKTRQHRRAMFQALRFASSCLPVDLIPVSTCSVL